MARPMTEEQFLAQVLELAEWLGWRTYHTRDSRGSSAGFPDLTLARRGRLVSAELKTETGRLSPDQTEWLAELMAVEQATIRANPTTPPVQTYLWRPSDWDAIQRVLGSGPTRPTTEPTGTPV